MADAKPNRMTVKPTLPPKAPTAPIVGVKPTPAETGYTDVKLANGDVVRTYGFIG